MMVILGVEKDVHTPDLQKIIGYEQEALQLTKIHVKNVFQDFIKITQVTLHLELPDEEMEFKQEMKNEMMEIMEVMMDETQAVQELKQVGYDQVILMKEEILESNEVQGSIKIMPPSQLNESQDEEIVRGLDQKNEIMEVLLVPMDAVLIVLLSLQGGSVQEGPLHLQMYALIEQLDSIQTVKPIQQLEFPNEVMASEQVQKCETMEIQEVEMDAMLGEPKQRRVGCEMEEALQPRMSDTSETLVGIKTATLIPQCESPGVMMESKLELKSEMMGIPIHQMVELLTD